MEKNLPRSLIVTCEKCNVALGYYNKSEWECETFIVNEKYKNDEQCNYIAFLSENKRVKIMLVMEINK